MNRVAREAGDPVDSILRKGRRGKVNGKHQHRSDGEAELPRLPYQKLEEIVEIHVRFTKNLATGPV